MSPVDRESVDDSVVDEEISFRGNRVLDHLPIVGIFPVLDQGWDLFKQDNRRSASQCDALSKQPDASVPRMLSGDSLSLRVRNAERLAGSSDDPNICFGNLPSPNLEDIAENRRSGVMSGENLSADRKFLDCAGTFPAERVPAERANPCPSAECDVLDRVFLEIIKPTSMFGR